MVKERLSGIGGSSRLLPGSSLGASGVGFPAFLELLPGAEGDHGAGGDRDILAGLGVAAGALVCAAQVEIGEARQLGLQTGLQALAQGVEERNEQCLCLAIVQADFLQ